MKVTIPVSNKEYTLIDTMTKKEVRRVETTMKPLLGFQRRLANATPEEMEKIWQDIDNISEEQATIAFNIFARCVTPTITKEYFENDMRNIEILILFNEIYHASTQLPLELAKRYASSSGTAGQQTTQNSK